MALVNEHFLKLPNNYLFADIAKKVNAFHITHPKEDVISLGIGDVTQPLCPAVIEAIHKAADDMATKQGILILTRYSSTMEPSRIRETYKNLYVGTTALVLPTLYILYI